jgi:hypothetical protein
MVKSTQRSPPEPAAVGGGQLSQKTTAAVSPTPTVLGAAVM